MTNKKVDEKWVVDLRDGYKGYTQSVLYDGVNPYYPERDEKYYVDQGYSILTWEEVEKLSEDHNNSLCGDWKEITENQFEEMLNVLPPLRWENGGFFMCEMWTDDVTGFYQQIGDRYFTSYQRLSYNRGDILDDLHSFIQQ